jgi:NADH:ubiquinone oxidoreductase subunit F (NADH-binding)
MTLTRLASPYDAWARAARETPAALIDLVERSGLAGKGGGAFPTHRKMRLMLGQSGECKTLVVNGSEHEPGSLKDRVLLASYPDLVLEGSLIMAHAVGATRIVVAINRASEEALGAVKEARARAVLVAPAVGIEIFPVPDAYLVGEETALLEVLEGRDPLPRKKPPFPIECGLNGAPTLVQNVETVAHLPLMVSEGADAYRRAGVTLCTFGAEFVHAGVHEVAFGITLDALVHEVGGGLRDGSPIKAVQTGGPSSGFIVRSDFGIPFEPASLANHGAALGCAVIRAYAEHECMVEAIASDVNFFARNSCGQCPPCRMETQMLDAVLRQTLRGKGKWQLLDRVDDIVRMAQGGGQCGLIRMPVAPIVSGLKFFRDEFAAHIDGNCPRCAKRDAHVPSTT